jgi:hypothetical protein
MVVVTKVTVQSIRTVNSTDSVNGVTVFKVSFITGCIFKEPISFKSRPEDLEMNSSVTTYSFTVYHFFLE